MIGSQKSKAIVKMLFLRRTLSRSTITAFMMLVMTVLMCQGQAGDIKVELKNVTTPLGGEGKFYCETEGENGQLWVDTIKFSETRRGWPDDIIVVFFPMSSEPGQPRITTINVTIPAKVEYNNTLVRCSDDGTDITSRAYFTVQGGPAEPEVSYKVKDYGSLKEILLTWPRPFTWEEYPITGYHIVCWDTQPRYEKEINDNATLMAYNVSHTLDLDIPRCGQLPCNVTASNTLASSNVSTSTISIPRFVNGNPSIQVETLFTEDKSPIVNICVKLPELCKFQSVAYTITIFFEGETVFERTETFSYSSGNSSDCFKVSGVLEEGVEYSVHVFVDAGESGNSSLLTPFKPEIRSEGVASSNKKEFLQTTTGLIVAIVAGTVLVALLLILITIVTLSYRRGKHSTQHHAVKAPVKRTTTPMVSNPIYDGESHESPFYEQVQTPLSLKGLNSTSSHSSLDTPSHRLPSPTQSTTTPTTPSHPLYSRAVSSPGSTTYNNSFAWPYSAVPPTDAATFDAIEADVNRLASCQTRVTQPPSNTSGEDSYMTMHSVANHKNVNAQNGLGQPRYAIDIHGNRYIEC